MPDSEQTGNRIMRSGRVSWMHGSGVGSELPRCPSVISLRPGQSASAERSALEVVRQATAFAHRTDRAVDPALLRPEILSEVPGIAGLHRVGGSVYSGLATVDGVPPDVMNSLGEQRRRWQRTHLRMLRAIGEFAPEFDDADVRWMVYKGAVLAGSVYPFTGDRASGDVDLLIHPVDIARAVRVLEELGYRHENHHWRHAAWLRRGEFTMVRDDVPIDVHWHVQYARHDRVDLDYDHDALHRRSRRLDLGGATVSAPSPEDSLMMTAHHACRSGGHRLVWSKDIERLLADEHLDHERFVAEAIRVNVGGQVALAIARAQRLLEFDAVDLVDRLGGAWAVRVDTAVTKVSRPIRSDDRMTSARRWAGSVRGTPVDTVLYVGRRARYRLLERFGTVPPSILDDEGEKQDFFRLVAGTQ